MESIVYGLETKKEQSIANIEVSILEEYSNYIKRKKANPVTQDNYIKGAKEFFKYLEQTNTNVINEATIDNYRTWLFKHKVLDNNNLYIERSYKASTINTRLATLRVFYKFLEKKGVTNYAKDLESVRVNTRHHNRDNLTLDQVKKILASIDTTTQEGARTNALVRLMVGTGIREIEAVNCTIGDLQTKGNKTILNVQGKGYNEIKDNTSDFVIITPSVLNAINQYLAYRPNAKNNEPLFTSVSDRNNGQGLTTRTIRKIVKDLYIKNGLVSERLTTHSLRHTAITLAHENGATAIEMQQMARHTNINTTMIYLHESNRLNNNAESKLEELLTQGA